MWVLLGAGVVLVVVGGSTLLFSPVSYGWFAYSPLSSSTSDGSFAFVGGMYPMTTERAIGATCAVAGLLLLVGLGGWVLGRRSVMQRQ